MNVLCKVKTRRNFTHQKKKKKRKDKEEKQKYKKLANGWRLGILSNTHLPLFLFHFLSILWKLNFGGSEEEIIGPHHFSLSIPLSIKHHFLPYFSFSLKSTQLKLKKFTLKFSTHKIVFLIFSHY